MILYSLRAIASSSKTTYPRRTLSTTCQCLLPSRSDFSRPGPPPLPPKEQAEFEALLKANQTIGATPAATAPAKDLEHRDLRKGPKPEFQGDVNPKTGEEGGPKVDPFQAGPGDWQYGGRVTVSSCRVGAYYQGAEWSSLLTGTTGLLTGSVVLATLPATLSLHPAHTLFCTTVICTRIQVHDIESPS